MKRHTVGQLYLIEEETCTEVVYADEAQTEIDELKTDNEFMSAIIERETNTFAKQQAEIDELKSELGKWTGASANEYGQTVQRLTKAQTEINSLKEYIFDLQADIEGLKHKGE